MQSALEFEIKTLLETSVEKQALFSKDALSIGVEYEFFLFSDTGTLANHEQGQNFLKKLADRKNWRIQEIYRDPNSNIEVVFRVSREDVPGFTAVKYDHHPHLFEIALSPSVSLHDLKSKLELVISEITEVANALNLDIRSVPFIESPYPESELTCFKELRNYRKKILLPKKSQQNSDFYNYASGIAATQFHIGGTYWWRDEDYVSRLHQYEPITLAIGALLASPDRPNDFLKRRWSGYFEVFSEFPLVGFPKMEQWNLSSWISAMLYSPLYSDSGADWTGKTVHSLGYFPFEGTLQFLKAVRDLQIIRPKIYGTIEFRSDPAFESFDSVLAMGSLRLGLSEAERMSKNRRNFNFSQLRAAWQLVNSNEISLDSLAGILWKAELGLKNRNLGEEKYLLPIRKLLLSDPLIGQSSKRTDKAHEDIG